MQPFAARHGPVSDRAPGSQLEGRRSPASVGQPRDLLPEDLKSFMCEASGSKDHTFPQGSKYPNRRYLPPTIITTPNLES